MQLIEGVADSLVGSGTATAPLANAILAQVAAPTPGIYRVRVILVLTGTAEAALQNLRLRNNTAAVGQALPTLSGAGQVIVELPRVTVTGGNLDLQVIAGATAGAIYNAVLIATRVG